MIKRYFPILLFVTLGFLLLGSCRTKKHLNSTKAVVMTEDKMEPVIDSVATDYPKPYYYPRLNSSFNPYTDIPKPPARLTSKNWYEIAYEDLKDMLEDKTNPDFELAVFISENPYYNNRFSYAAFQNSINEHLTLIENLIAANDKSDSMNFDVSVNQYGRFRLADIRYLPHEKKELYQKALSNWAIFKYLTDTVFIYTVKDSSVQAFYHAPYEYATSDPFGMKDWANSQVIHLLASEKNKGNCFALTALYKILSDRLHADARLCTAPQHIYIQHRDPKGQYYNVELATAGHPGDGIIQTLTYTPKEAIMSGIALRDYTVIQSIGLCLVNLAKSYEHQFHTKDDEFLLRCAELALAHDSLNLNAMLLKAQVLDTRVTAYATKHHLKTITQLKKDTGISATVLRLEKHLSLLEKLGYRQMPADMQEMILNPFQYDPKKWNHQSQNARPFTTFEPKDPKDAEYWTLTKGMFKEIWEPTALETYGHFTLNTQTHKLTTIDTTSIKGALIDPVAFAYDFGARMYDARVGRFIGVDKLLMEAPGWTPYRAFFNNPLYWIDNDGNIEWPLKGNQAVDKKDTKNGGYGLTNTIVRTSTYMDTDRPPGATNPHIGIDYRASVNTPFYSLADGKVVDIGKTKKEAMYIVVEYGNGDKIRFLHINNVIEGIKKGDKVYEGQILGYSGKTGTIQAHLHVDGKDANGNRIDPENMNYGNYTNEEFFETYQGDYKKLPTYSGDDNQSIKEPFIIETTEQDNTYVDTPPVMQFDGKK